MRILVTGADGFVAYHLISVIKTAWPDSEVILTRLGASPTSIPGTQQVQLDIRDFTHCTEVFGAHPPDLVFHLAGIAFAPQAEIDFKLPLDVHVLGTDNVCRALVHSAAGKNTIPAFIHVSTSEIFGLATDGAITTDSPIEPSNNYGISKRASELVVERYHRQEKIRALICRPFNHIGPGQNDRFVASTFAQQCAKIALGQADAVVRVGNLEAERDFSDVRDVVRGYVSAAQWLLKSKPGQAIEHLIFASGKPVKVRQLLEILISFCGRPVSIEIDSARARPSDIPRRFGSSAYTKKLIGWEPTIDLETSLHDIFHDWKSKLSGNAS